MTISMALLSTARRKGQRLSLILVLLGQQLSWGPASPRGGLLAAAFSEIPGLEGLASAVLSGDRGGASTVHNGSGVPLAERGGSLLAAAETAAGDISSGHDFPSMVASLAEAASSGGAYLEIEYSVAMQPLVSLEVGGQRLKVVFDCSTGNTAVFVKERGACDEGFPCYSYDVAHKGLSVHICQENNKLQCYPGHGGEYPCQQYLDNLTSAEAREDNLIIDGLNYKPRGVEAKDEVGFFVNDASGVRKERWSDMPVRLLVAKMKPIIGTPPGYPALFSNVSGVLGASGPTLSCRNESVWHVLMQRLKATSFALDLHPPPQAKIRGDAARSGIVFHHIDKSFLGRLVWSQPKQTGDVYNDGTPNFLLYHPSVCGVDLLSNTSSNWLAVVDTSGPCLALPDFLFDRLRSHVPLSCPFAIGELSFGRLCSPPRSGGRRITLPSLNFQLQDLQEPEPESISFPLERLVFSNGTEELLCLTRADVEPGTNSIELMDNHISFGSLAVSAFYMVVNMSNSSIGMASRGDARNESTQDFCAPPVTCLSPAQTYYAPANVCEDPPCSEYLFMTLDETTRTCQWTRAVPFACFLLLGTLAMLDWLSHRCYKQAIAKASEPSQ